MRSRILLSLLVVVAACERAELPVAPAPIDPAVTSSSGGKIAFVSSRDGNNEIYVMNADGTGVTRLTNNPADDRAPAWSPDGSHLAFMSTRDGNPEIYTMDATGGAVTRLTNDPNRDMDPAWCGTRIAFMSDRFLAPMPDIYVMNDDGTGVTRLTIDNASFDEYPAWSPQCDRIAFTKDPSGKTEIYVMNADGTGVHPLMNRPGYDQDPAWSPDGTRIAFTSSTTDPRDDNREIFVMNADGTGITALTTTTWPVWNSDPVWSPDGTKIAFNSNRDGDHEIYVMNPDGSGLTQLTSNTVGDILPAWFGSELPPPPPPPALWPNEPAGFQTLSDQSWSCPSPFEQTVVCNGWLYAQRGSTTPDDVIADPTAPFSSADVLRIVFTPDMGSNMEPSVHWLGLPSVKTLYTAWWIKLSPNWDDSPWAAGAMTALFADGPNQIYTAFFHPCVWPEVCDPEAVGPPYKIGASTEWAAEEQQIRYPNATTTWINPGEWHRVEFYYQWSTTPTSNDGIIRWWVDGTLNGDYSNVHYPAGSFVELQYAPTLQQAPPAEQYMYIDHTRVSVAN